MRVRRVILKILKSKQAIHFNNRKRPSLRYGVAPKGVSTGRHIYMYNTLLKNIYAAIAALFITMLALPTTAQAQGKARIILEAHNVWGDGSGYQMLLDANHNLYGDKIPEKGALWDNANPPADLYNSFEHKIPGNADPSTTPQYMVVDGEGYVDIPAGVYDFCIAAPEAGKKIWIAGDKDGPTRADDYRFEAGKTYRFTMYAPDGGGDAAKLTITQTGEVQNYDLQICGTQVTSDNCGNLSWITGVNGKVSYDPSTKTLTLEKATIYAGQEQAITSRTDGLTIKLIGENNLNSSKSTMGITEALTITGEGATLNVVSENSCAVYSNTADITIENCSVNLKGEYGFLARNDDKPESLIIKEAKVTIDGKQGTIEDFTHLTMKDCGIIQPEGAVFDESRKTVVVNGERVKGKLVIAPNVYDLKIVGNDVTFDNCGDLTVFDGVSGTVKYDPRSNILTLKDASITSTTTNAIVSHIDGLTIELIGTNSLTTKENSTLSFTHPLTLTGGGTLNVSALSECGIYLNDADLTINDCIVNVKGVYGIAGRDGSNEKLLIRNATVTAEGEQGSICDLASLTLEYSNITQPSGARFDESAHAVVLNGEKVKSKIVITRDPAGINTPTIDTAAKQGIYTLSGAKLGGKVEDLPKGIYIVNGKKVVK